MAESRLYQADPDGRLTPEDYNYFRSAKWRIKDTYGLGLTQNEYQSKIAGNAYTRSLGDLTRQFTQARQNFSTPWAARGMLNSGAYNNALGQFQNNRAAAIQNLASQHQDTAEGYTIARQQLDRTFTNANADVDAAEAARRAAVEAIRAAVG